MLCHYRQYEGMLHVYTHDNTVPNHQFKPANILLVLILCNPPNFLAIRYRETPSLNEIHDHVIGCIWLARVQCILL